MLWPSDPARRTAVMVFAAPFLFAMLVAVIGSIAIDSLWAISMLTLLPVLLLSSPRIAIPRSAAVAVLTFAVLVPFALLAASPAIALIVHRAGVSDFGSDYQLVARAVSRAWRANVGDKPLRIIGSTEILNGVDFYLPSQPATFDIVVPTKTPWTTRDLIRRDGIALVCPDIDTACMVALKFFTTQSVGMPEENVIIARRFFGTDDQPVGYEIGIVPPQAP
jgi:hypothetical protein